MYCTYDQDQDQGLWGKIGIASWVIDQRFRPAGRFAKLLRCKSIRSMNRAMTDDVGTEFSWQAHPARERIGAAALALGVIGAVAGVVLLSFQSLAWATAACLVLLAALSRFFFPSRFMIDADGITARYLLRTQQIKWRDIRRFVQDDRGGYISTRAKRSWLDAYRGMHILFGTHRETVIKRIRARLADGAAAWAH